MKEGGSKPLVTEHGINITSSFGFNFEALAIEAVALNIGDSMIVFFVCLLVLQIFGQFWRKYVRWDFLSIASFVDPSRESQPVAIATIQRSCSPSGALSKIAR